MERLYKIVGLVFVAACILAGSAAPVAARDYCSLKVRVLAPANGKVEVPVVVKERNGRTIEREQDLGSEDVLFCDLGILPVTVIVGQRGCNQTTVEDVPLSWQKTYNLVVNYDYVACMQETVPPPVPYCEILLRVKKPDGEWIKEATIKFDNPAYPERQTDSAGRSLFSVKAHGSVRGSVIARGYVQKDFSFGCPDVGNREEILTLEGSGPRSRPGSRQQKPVEPRLVKQGAGERNPGTGTCEKMQIRDFNGIGVQEFLF